ncbi:hypothetical protein BKA63DRAFT_423691 [Paraphoma chrysanthemicola]|nr:hypothetical protein BKA63DRAFT_423691 [Paraphoma chrysanthemicola]
MEVDIAPQFGAELKDGFKSVNAWVSGGIAWLDDIQQFYRERSAIEKEYSAKLSALAKKYYEKKARKVSSLSVGDTPTVTPGSLESASMTTWGVQLSTLESRAAEHEQFAGALVTQLADPLKTLATRYEDLRKLHGDYAAKLEKERDSQYTELRKQKGKYDSVCQEVENRRKKSDGAFDYGKTKAKNAFEQQQVEMRNVKNTYIISINVTNKQKEMYYHEYVPELLDSLQDLSETRVNKLNSIWSLAASIETQTLSRSAEYMKHLSAEIPRNNPLLDSMMFVRHNAGGWQEPGDFQFEPSPVWLDDGSIAVDESATTFLRNVLTKSKSSLGEHKRELDKKRKEVENAKAVRRNIREGKDKRDEVDVVRAVFAIQEVMHEIERQKVSAEVEVSTITSVVGDLSIGARNHNFKSQTFKIPTNCDLCGDRIWGLSAKGFDCRDCGYTCHSKCEMKVPADCPGEQSKEEKKKLKEERQKSTHTAPASNGAASGSHQDMPKLGRSDTVNSMNTLSSGYSATAHRSISGGMSPTVEDPPVEKKAAAPAPAPGARRNRIVAPPPAQYIKDDGDVPPPTPKSAEVKGRMLYGYESNGEGELTVPEGRDVSILEPDGRSYANLSPMFQILLGASLTNDYTDAGWTKVRAGSKEGLVPSSYVEVLTATPPTTASTFSSSNRPDSTYSASSASTTNLHAAVAGKKKGPAVAPKRGAKKLKYVEALYDYTAQSDAEHSMSEGDRFVLINMEAGDGWADVERDGVVRSVPANYIQQVLNTLIAPKEMSLRGNVNYDPGSVSASPKMADANPVVFKRRTLQTGQPGWALAMLVDAANTTQAPKSSTSYLADRLLHSGRAASCRAAGPDGPRLSGNSSGPKPCSMAGDAGTRPPRATVPQPRPVTHYCRSFTTPPSIHRSCGSQVSLLDATSSNVQLLKLLLSHVNCLFVSSTRRNRHSRSRTQKVNMRISDIATIAAVAGVAAAGPHGYLHRHAHRDARPDAVVYAPAAIETVLKYILDGHEISADDVRQGIANGTLEWGADGILSTSALAPVAIPTPKPKPEDKPKPKPVEDKPKSDPKPSVSAQPVEKPVATSSTEAAPKPSGSGSQVDTSLKTAEQLVDKDGSCASCDTEFPNNKIPCTQFPYGYGAMPIHQEGLGGWSGIQDPVYRGADGFDNIRTTVSGSCKDGSCCKPGSFCSYGCPNPYLKLSFPKKQGRTGQTVGGLYCNDNGKLEMADGSIGKSMCGPDSRHMKVKVQNKLSKSVSICRTDYPGTESMTFPLTVGPGQTGFLANPDQNKYFFWSGNPTSAHYYVNKQGVSEDEACTWAKPGDDRGNWAPAIIGTSWDDINMNQGYSSLKQNELRKDVPLDYSITFTGDGVVSPCKYKKSLDQYCQADDCWSRKEQPDRGCTAGTKQGGTLIIVLSDD